MNYLFYHPESSCLFWQDSETPIDDLCNLMGQSPRATDADAKQIYDNYNAVFNIRNAPKFETIYRAPEKGDNINDKV